MSFRNLRSRKILKLLNKDEDRDIVGHKKRKQSNKIEASEDTVKLNQIEPNNDSVELPPLSIVYNSSRPLNENQENIPFDKMNSLSELNINSLSDFDLTLNSSQINNFYKLSDTVLNASCEFSFLDSNHMSHLDPENTNSVNSNYISNNDTENLPQTCSNITSSISKNNAAEEPLLTYDKNNMEKSASEIPAHFNISKNIGTIMSGTTTCISNVIDTQFQYEYHARSPKKILDYQNQDREESYYDNVSCISESSKDRDYIPSSSTSSSDDQIDLLMENECLEGTSKMLRNDTKEKGKTHIEEIRSDNFDEDKQEINEENIEAPKKTTQDKERPEESKSKRIRERDFCYYCENLVLNFSRHMIRNHLAEFEVQLALSHPKNSIKRKRIFSDLRKKGNYISNSQTAFKPVKKCRFTDKSDYLPCSKCLGFYSKKQLWRHVKKCKNTSSTNKAQVEAQNFLVRNVKIDNNLLIKVFPRMKPDKVSLIAKKDKLISMFGAHYLKTHREEHFATVVSRKMRELAKLLIEITKMKPEIQSLEQILKPQYYDTLVIATKIVARYNNETRQFAAPTYAMNIATSIKQCCSIALLQSYKTEATIHTASIQADLKSLSQLISENWKFDISSEAANDLNIKKWNKTTIVPLATDLKMFKDYISTVSKRASDNLKQSMEKINIEAFDNLVESTYCRVLLLNRRRPGELQRLKLNEYNKHCSDSNKYEEFNKILSVTEKILVDKLKRIVIRGKRGRGVPVLFTTEIQDNIKQIISVRNLYIKEDNNLLFVKAGGVTVCGYKILEKYAKACGAKNYQALTSTRLRKHLATMTQLFDMSESELEQLATFMGHTLSVHKDNYRLPSDVYQTAKISKLLLLMEDGKADKYQGKALDDIDLNLDEEITGDVTDNEEVVRLESESEDENTPQNDNISVHKSIQEDEKKSAKKKRILIPWTTEQKEVVTKYFKQHIKNKKAPKRAECDELKNKYPTLLHNKDWLKIKVFIQNIFTKK